MEMFSFRITKTEFSQHSPIKGYDVCYSDFRGCEIYKVPILSIYGTTPAGQKGCLHVHGVFPYMCLRWSDVFPEILEVNSRKYLQELALEIDKALNTDAGRSSSSRHHVHNIIITKGKLIYGFHQSDEDFLKIYFYNPNDVSRTIDLLTKSKVLKKSLQPCYAHIPFRLQFYTDYNLGYGVIVNVSSYQFRDVRETCNALHADSAILLPDSNTSSHKVWNISTLTSSQVSDIPRDTDQELELDCHETSILNKKDSLLCIGKNPGIAAIWDEERERRRLEQNSSQFTPPSTIERVVMESDSEIHFKNLFNKRCESDVFKQFEKNGEIGYITDSQNSFHHLSSESVTFSNTQEKELLDMCISMYANQGPDDDSILAAKNDSISDDEDEVTLEMSQQFTDEILSDIHPNSHSESKTSDNGKSLNQRQHLIPQLDGAFDDEKFGTKQDKSENTDHDEPPRFNLVHPHGNHRNRNIQSSAEATTVKNSKTAEEIKIPELRDNFESISDKMKKNVSKKLSLLSMNQNDKRQMKKLNTSVTKCMESIITRVEKMLNEKSESHSFGSKECGTNNTSNLFVQSCPNPYENKTRSRKEECFIGARPKTTKNIPSISSRMSKSIQKKKNTLSEGPPDLSGTLNLSNVSESPVVKLNLSDSARIVEQVNTTSNFKAQGPAISTNSPKHALKNKRTNLHTNSVKEDFLNVSCSTKVLMNSDSVPDKNIINPTNKKFPSSTSDNIKISSSNRRKPPLTVNKFLGTESLDEEKKDCFNIVTDLKNVNFSKVGREAVLIKKLTEEEINAATLGCHKISLKSDQTENLNSKSCHKTNHQKNVKNSHKNKGKSSDPYKMKNLKGQLPVIKSNNAQKLNECVSSMKMAISNTNIKNSKCVAVNDNFSSPEKISLAKKNRSHNVDSKNSVYFDNSNITSLETNMTYNLNQKVLEVSSIKEGTFNNNKIKTSNVPHFNVGFNGSGEMIKNLEPKALFSGTIISSYDSLINVKEAHSDFKNSSGHHNQENVTDSFISKPINSAGSCSLSYSKIKGNMKDKNVSESRRKKLESAYHLNKKHIEQDAAEIHENFDVDSKKDIEETFKHSLQERNILYHPQPKTADAELLTKSHTKTFQNESNLFVDNIKVKCDSSLHQIDESAKQNIFFDNIVRNSPFVFLTDCLRSGEGQTKHDCRKKYLASKKTVSRPYRYPSVSIKSEQKESNILSKAKRNTSITYSKNSDVKVPKNATKPKESQIPSALYNFCCKMQRASCDAINSKEIPTCAFEKNNPVNTSPFSVKPKINSELKVYSSCNAASDDCQNTGCSAIGPKPSIKSKYLDDNLMKAKAQNTVPSHYDNNSYNKNLSINSATIESVSTVSVRDNINEDISKPNLIFPLVSYNTLNKNKNRGKQKNCLEVVLNDPEEGIINASASKKNIKSKPKEFSKPKDSRVPVIPKSIKNPNSKVNSYRSDNSFVEKLKTEISEPNLKHTKEVNYVPTENSKTSDENIGHFVHSHPSIMKTATVKDNSKSYCGYTGIEKIPEANSVNVSNSESKLNSTEPWNNNNAPSYLYDIVKLRNASKQNSSNASKISNNNNNSSIASKGKAKKNTFNNKSENAKSSGDKLNANSANQSQSAFETEKLASASKTKKYVSKSESEKTAAASIAKNCRSKLEYEFRSKNTLLKKNSDHADRKDHSEIKLFEEPISDLTNQFTAISKSNTSSLIKEKIQSSPTLSKNHNDISKNTLLYPTRGRPAKKSGSSNNFGFFSSKIPQRRCQNDIETSQIPKPTSSKLSLKLNKKGANVNAKRESTTLVDSKTKWKIDNLPYDNQSERSASTETVANQQVSEAVAFVPNIRIKKEPPDDYEVSLNNNMKDALSCFDFDENSCSDATSYLSSSSKHSRNSKDQTVEMSSKERDILPRNGKNKYKKNSKHESAPLISKPNRSRKSVVEITHSDIIKENSVSFDSDASTSQNNNTSSNNRYPKRSCSFTSSVEDEVVILEDIPSSSAKSLKSKARSSRCLVSEVIDLEKEEDSLDRSSVITIKRDSDGNNSIIPNKKRFSDSEPNLNSVNIVESRTPSTSSYNNVTDSCSKNLDDSSDSKQSLKLKLRVKTILTRSNEPKFVILDRQLQGHNNDEIDSSDIIHIKKEPGIESPKRKHSKIRQNYQQTSTRSNPCEPIVPPILIKDIKKEKDDDYEKKPYVAPLKVNLSTLNVTEVERPNTNTEPKLEPLRLCRKSNKFYVGTGSSANNELPENNDDNFNNRNSTPPKRKRGRPAKVQNSSSPQKDISPLKNNTSFNGNSNAGCLTVQIPKKPASEQSFDIDKKCSFRQSCKKGQSDTDKNSAVKWWWEVEVKKEPKSDTEDPCSSNAASCSQKNEIITISKRRNSLRCESFKKFFDSDHSDDDDKKPKTNEVKPQKKRKRSKSVNCESNKKIFIEANEISSLPNRRTSARKGSFKKYYDSDKGENSSDDCKVVCVKKVEKPKKPGHRKKKRQYTTKNKQSPSSDKLTLPCNPCSVTLERLSPSLLEQNVAAKTAQNIFQPGRQTSVECTISQNNDIKKISESNSFIPESQHIAQMNHPESILSVPGAIEHISTKQFSSNVEKSSFKAMDKKVAHAFSISVENTGTKFIPDSGPVTINGLNSINMDNSLSEFLCDEMISENKMNCSPFMYNSPPLSTDSNMISNSNPGKFLRRTSHEMEQCLFESPSSILKNGSMDSQSPLLYSQSPIMDVKQVSDPSPDNRYLHLSPQAFKQQTNLMHSSIFNSETIFENSSIENFEMSNNSIRESLRTTDRDFNKGRQQRGMNTYATASESHNESRRSIPSMISNSIDKCNVHVNISKDMHNPLQLHSKDFDRGHQHNSSYTLRNSPMDQNTEFLTYSAKGIGNLDKTPSEPHDSLKTPDSNLKRRKNDISCFSSAYSELRRPSKQVRHEESNTEKDHSCLSNSYNASAEVRQSPTSYSTPNLSGYNNAKCSMIHSRSEKPLNTLKSHNEYFGRMKWDNPHHSSKNNGSFSEDNKSQMNHFPVQQNRYVGYYAKPNDSDPNANSRTSNEPYYRSNWPDVNTRFPHNDRSLYGFSPNDGSFNDFSLNKRSTVETFKKSPIQQEFKKYDGNFCKISNQIPRSSLSASNEEFHAPKSTDVNFSHLSDYDCNPKKSQPSNDKNPFNKNMEVFFLQPGFSSNSPNTMSPSAIPCSSPMGISKSPLQPEPRVAFKKEVINSPESNGTGSKNIDICEQSPTNSFSDHMETVLSPIISNSSSVPLSSRSLNNVEKHRNEVKSPLIGELSSDYPTDANDVKPYIGDFNPNSANSSKEIITILSESDDAVSEYDLNIKSSDISGGARQNDSETPINDNDKDIVFEETLNLIEGNASFDLLSEEIVSKDESFLTAYNIFSNSPQNKVSEDTSIPSNRANNTVKSSLTIINTLSSANQNTVPDLTPSTYDGSFDWKIVGFQEHADDNNSELRHLSGGFETNCMSSFLSQDNNDGDKGNDNESAKSELQTCHENSIQLSDIQNNNCPLFVEAVPNVNVIVTNTSEMDSTNAILPLESFKNAVLPVVSVNNSVKSDALCFTQPSTSATYDSVNPSFLSSWMVNDSSLVLPQSNFFFNNGSFIISGNSGEEEGLNFLQNPETLENSSTNNISEENSKDTQKMQSLKKSFNSGDDILSMIVKSCDIGEEFDENFSPSKENMDDVDVAELDNPSEKIEKASFLGLANGTNLYTINNSNLCSPRNIYSCVVSPINEGESVVHTSELYHQISENQSTEKINSSSSLQQGNQTKSNQCLESCQSSMHHSHVCSPRNISPGAVSPENQAESVHASEFSHQISESQSTGINSSASLLQGNQTQSSQCLESCQDRSSIQDSAPLDSMVQSFYNEDTLSDLNSSTNCDILSYHCSSQYCDVPSIPNFKNSSKLFHDINVDDNIKMEKVVSIISPNQSIDLPSNGNLLLIVKSRPISNKITKFHHVSVDKNNQLEIKEIFSSDKINKKKSKYDTVVIGPGNVPPLYIRLLFGFMKSLHNYKTDNSPKGPYNIKIEYTDVDNGFETNSPCDKHLVLCRTLCSELLAMDKTLVGTPSLKKLSPSVNLESTPSAHRPLMQKIQLKELNVSPISKDILLTRCTKKKRKLSFSDGMECSGMLEGKNKKYRKISVEEDKLKELQANATSSDIDGPTLENSRGFRVNIEDCGRIQHEAQHLTIMSLEIHVNTRNSLNPDPKNDPVSVIFYSIYNESETYQQEVVGVIAVDSSQKDCSLKGSHAFKTNFLNLLPGVKTSQVFIVEDEKAAFEKLVCVVKEWDPDILVGFEIQMLSWGYLIERANFLNINLPSMISRLLTKNEEPKFEHVQEDNTVTDQTADIDRINIPGRIVLNLWRLLRKEITLNVYSFENVCYHVLHRRIPCYTPMKLTEWFLGRHKEIIVRFYVSRVLGSIQILEKLDTIRRTGEMARLYGIDFYEVLSRGSQFRVESMMLRTAAPMRYFPVSPSVQQRSHSRAPECVPLIMEPESKFYQDPVVVLDFQSLYPSIMIAYNYCFSTCLGRLEHLGKDGPFEFGCTSLTIPPSLLRKLALEDNIHFSPQGVAFVRSRVRKGVLPVMLEEILNARIMVKQSLKKIKNNNALKKLLDARQLGLKLISNVTYGYTGASFSGRMPCVEVADSIVGKARETLERAIKLIENTPEWRASVIYGDTDSLFIYLPGRSLEEAFKLGYEIADAVTRTNPEPVKLKFEKVYLPCVLQTKKRYCGFMYETPDQESPIFDAKGIETVRRDSCPATAKILEKSLKILFQTQDVDAVKFYVQKQFTKILKGRVSIIDFVFAKEYRGMSGYRPGACVPALEIAKKRLAKDPRAEPRSGERVPYVIVYGFPGMPIIRLVHEPADLLRDPSLRINATYYITRVISPPLERIFSLLGANVKSWYSELTHVHRLNLPMINHSKETITQYFTSRRCPSCKGSTYSPLCIACQKDWVGTVADLQIKIRDWGKTPDNLKQICVSCTKSTVSVDYCSSMDCPVLFKLYLANIDLAQAPYLRKILTREIRELF